MWLSCLHARSPWGLPGFGALPIDDTAALAKNTESNYAMKAFFRLGED